MSAPGGTSVAPIYDPLSARIAEILGWEVCKLSGSVGKFASLAVPDGVAMTNSSDLIDTVRRITRVADMPLVLDADDGGPALALYRTIRELESAGMAGIELEDNVVPTRFIADRHSLFVPAEEQAAKLRAAVAARRDSSTVIIGRTAALNLLPLDEALERIALYGKTGIDALCLPGQGARGLSSDPRSDLEAVADASGLPLCVSGLPQDLLDDSQWLHRNRVALRYNPQVAYRSAVRAIYDSLRDLKAGVPARELKERWASADVLDAVVRTDELRAWDETYGYGSA
jgi:carboxyvinyl-carboxyphosphonate phosphorylmutase